MAPPSDEVTRLQARVAELESQLAARAADSPLVLGLGQSPIAAVGCNASFRIVEWNQAAENLFGYRREEVLGRSMTETIVPDEAFPQVEQAMLEVMEQRGGAYNLNENRTQDGRTILCQWFNVPILNEQRRAVGFIGFAQDARVSQSEETLHSPEQWRSLVQEAPEVIITADIEGTIQYINRVELAYSREAILGRKLYEFVAVEHREIVRSAIEAAVKTHQPQSYEVQDLYNRRWYSATLGPYFQRGELTSLIVLVRETTQRKQGEEALQQSNVELSAQVANRTLERDRVIRRLEEDIALRKKLEGKLRESEERFRAIATSVPVPMVITEIATGTILYANTRLSEMLGLPTEQVIGTTSFAYYFDPSDRETLMERLRREGPVRDHEIRFRRPDGAVLWTLVTVRPLMYQGKDALVSSILDITERHEAEQTLRRERRLLQRLLELQERDRQLIAYEIHDGFVQDVVGGKMLLEAVLARLAEDEQHQELRQALGFLTRAIDEGRRMIGELRPMIIDEEGIVAAIMYLINGEMERGGPEIDFTENIHFDRVDPMLEGAAFRIVQEALANALRHSHSERIAIRLTQVDAHLHIEVSDEGVGFEVTQVPEDRFGLQGIQERARLFGGRATIDSRPGGGTRVHAVLPLEVDSDEPLS